ncbi:siderophore-interacting protein [Frankia sp. QA3]|nr:siderophore-interacting protein [Frankia sp. QA3]
MSLHEAIRAVATDRAQRPIRCELQVDAVTEISPSFRRITLRGAGLAAYTDPLPADAFRLFPSVPAARDGAARDGAATAGAPGAGVAPSRAFTVRTFDPAAERLAFDAFAHGAGLVDRWLRGLGPGTGVGITGMRVEFVLAPVAAAAAATDPLLLVADGSGLPAAAAILAALPAGRPALAVLGGVATADRVLVPARPGHRIRWVRRHALPEAVRTLPRLGGAAVAWVAAEAAQVRIIRRHLVELHGVPRSQVRTSAYWKAGFTMDDLDAAAVPRQAEAVAEGWDERDPEGLAEIVIG